MPYILIFNPRFIKASLFIILILLTSLPTLVTTQVHAATTNDSSSISVAVGATISISTPSDVTLGSITGTGSSSEGTATWTITTNNSSGYKLEWSASAANMVSGADTITAYSPAVANTPETWSIDAATSEWGARLKSTSTDSASEWGTDSSSEKWLNVATTSRQIVSRNSETSASGSEETIAFKAEVGGSKMQPTGSYTVNITVTATTL
jgi:hypothetical protein